MKAFLYARVSTGEQNEGMQVAEMVEFAKKRGWEPEVFTDTMSGGKEKRPGLDRMMALARKRKCDVVLVYRYDRFARSLRQLVNALAEFDALGINFVSLHEGVDTSTINGRLIFGIFASIAEFERALIQERVKSGVAYARSQGIRLGRPRIDVDVEKIALLRAQNFSWREIGARLGISHTQAIRAHQQAVTKSSEVRP